MALWYLHMWQLQPGAIPVIGGVRQEGLYSRLALATWAVDGVRESCTVHYLSAYKNDRASVCHLWTYVVNDDGFVEEISKIVLSQRKLEEHLGVCPILPTCPHMRILKHGQVNTVRSVLRGPDHIKCSFPHSELCMQRSAL